MLGGFRHIGAKHMPGSYEWSDASGFAEFYESYFVPALFGDWSKVVIGTAELKLTTNWRRSKSLSDEDKPRGGTT